MPPVVAHLMPGKGGTQMGLLDGLLGHGSDISPNAVMNELRDVIIDDETIAVAFKVIRDLMVFTDRRME